MPDGCSNFHAVGGSGAGGRGIVDGVRAAALLSFEFDVRNPDDHRLLAIDSRGTTELDHDPAIHDVTLDGTRVRWLHGDEQREADLR